MTPILSLIAAIGTNNVIGHAGAIPWRLSTDQGRFKQLTLGKPIIMGRHTLEAIGRPLDGRDNIVLSRDDNLAQHWPGVLVVSSPEEALRVAREKAATRGADEIMVTAQVFDHKARLRSFEILAEAHRELSRAA